MTQAQWSILRFFCIIMIASFPLIALRIKRKSRQLSREDAIKIIDDFLNNKTSGPYDWDDFLTLPIADPELDAIRRRCDAIDRKTELGRQQIEEELKKLRGNAG